MTELEKIVYTKSFIDKLANGINPLDGTLIPENDLMNNVRLSRCMFYVSDILRQLIEQGGIAPQKINKVQKQAFYLTLEQRNNFSYSDMPICASDIAKRMNEMIDGNVMKKMTYKAIASWLINEGFLYEKEQMSGKVVKRPTSSGEMLGITEETRNGMNGAYVVVVYNREAQQFILDNLDAIISFEAESKSKAKEQKSEDKNL